MPAPVILDHLGRPAAVPDVKARYEAAWYSSARSMLPTVVASAQRDISSGTRRRLLANSRYLYKNNPLVRAIVERLVVYTVGSGIRAEPDSSDPAWNKRAAAAWEGWWSRASLTTRHTFGQLQAISVRSMLVDGDVFLLKTYGESGRPRIQLIESHLIGDPDKALPTDTTDGVEFDKVGRPRAYLMPQPGREPLKLPAESVAILANIERADQHRGVCLWASAINTAIDLHDLLAIEKAAVKVSAAKVDVVKTQGGEIDPEDAHRAAGGSVADDTGDRAGYYQRLLGPETKVLKSGDEYQLLTAQRPSAAWAGFVDFLAELTCLAFNLPPSMVRQLKVGGADTRRDLATAQRVVEILQELVAGVSAEVWEYVIGAEIEDGALGDAPPDWRNVSHQFPRAMTVDAGRMSQQERADLASGNVTLQENVGQYGGSYRRHLKQLAREEREVAEVEKAEGLKPGTLASRLYGRPLQAPAPGQVSNG